MVALENMSSNATFAILSTPSAVLEKVKLKLVAIIFPTIRTIRMSDWLFLNV